MRSLPDIRRLLTVAVVLPSAFVLIDHTAFQFANESNWAPAETLLLCVLFIAQIGVLGVAVGRLLDRWAWRIGVYTWAILLINLWLFVLTTSATHREAAMLSFALVSAQIGVLATWLVLGPPPWQWRLPLITLVALPLGLLFGGDSYEQERWIVIVSLQSGGLLAALVGLRIAAYRIAASEDRRSRPSAIPQHQYSMKHMFSWATVVAIVIVVMKAIDLRLNNLGEPVDWIGQVILGAILAVVTLTAIWASLSQRHGVCRFVGLVGVAVVAGAAAQWLTSYYDAQRPTSQWHWNWRMLSQVDWLWIAWTCLMAGFLAAMLLLLRSTGYRLVREAKR